MKQFNKLQTGKLLLHKTTITNFKQMTMKNIRGGNDNPPQPNKLSQVETNCTSSGDMGCVSTKCK
jgi:hypothetical protein